MTDKTEDLEIIEEKDERFRYDPEAMNRIYSTLSYFIVMFVIGLPVWWQTTKVYRAPLPLDEMFAADVPNKTIRQNSIPLSIEYDVLITVINPNPINLKLDLDMYEMNVNLQPFLKIVSPLANFTVKSQWVYLADLGVIPVNNGDHLILREDQLPHTITPLEKKIWSHMSPNPCLNLIVYSAQCGLPLYIHDKNDQRSSSNAFLSPGWGGVTILNPDSQSCENKRYKPDLKPIISILVTQLMELLGLKSTNPVDVNELKIVKAQEMIDSTKRTLKSLAQLLSEINSIVISDDVGEKIELAVNSSKKAERFLENGDVNAALKAAKIGFKNSEDAFSDPSLLALLYFPDDQKYAVYIPLFLPIIIPVVMSITTIKRCYMNSKGGKLKED